MKWRMGLVVGAASLAIASAQAQTPCPASDANPQTVSFELADRDVVMGLTYSILFGLNPATFPYEEVAEMSEACSRGVHQTAAGGTIEMFGSDTDTPPRWAVGADEGTIVYIAVMPPVSATQEWMKNGREGGISFKDGGLYALTVTDGDLRHIYAIFDDIPGDELLGPLFEAALTCQLTPWGTFDQETGATDFVDPQTQCRADGIARHGTDNPDATG